MSNKYSSDKVMQNLFEGFRKSLSNKSIVEGRFEEDPEFAQDMSSVLEDLKQIDAYIREVEPEKAKRFNWAAIGAEWSAAAGGGLTAAGFADRLKELKRTFYDIGTRPSFDNFIEKYGE